MPNVQALADQGVLFREAFCAAPTCSASRACLLTGQYGQSNGMLGLAHRGWSLRDYSHHIVHTLRKVGYTSTLIGEQHISKDPQAIGYDEVIKVPTTRVESVAPLAMEVLRRAARAAAVPVGRLLRDAPRIPRPGLAARRALLKAAQQPARRARGARRRRRLQGQRALAGPRRRHGAQRARRLAAAREHAGDLHDRPRHAVPRRQGDAVRPRARRDADPARARAVRRRARARRRSSRTSTSTPRCASYLGIERPPFLQGVSLLALLRGEVAQRARGDLRRLDLARRLRAPARGAHRAPQVHPPLGRAAHAGAAEHRRRPEQGPAAAQRLGRARDRQRAALRPAVRPQRGQQPARRSRLRRRAGRPARAPRAAGCATPKTRCSPGTSTRRRASRSTCPTSSPRPNRRRTFG